MNDNNNSRDADVELALPSCIAARISESVTTTGRHGFPVYGLSKAQRPDRPEGGQGGCEWLVGLETIYDSAYVGLCVLDTDLRFRRINERLARINGAPAATHIGRTLREMAPDRADQSEALLRRVLDTGEALPNCEITALHRTWVEHYVPLKDAAGRVIAINVAVEEITAQKQAEAALLDLNLWLESQVEERTLALRQSELRLKQAAEVGRMKAFEWDPLTDEVKHSGTIGCIPEHARANAAEGQTGRWFFAHIHPDDRPTFINTVFGLTPECSTYHIQYRFLPPDGKLCWCEESGRGFFDHQGKLIRLVGMTADITARKQAEQAVHKHLEALAHTDRLHTVGELTSMLAHEINQPLMAIEHFIHAAQQLVNSAECNRESLTQLLSSSREQVQRTSKVVHHLREFVRRGKVNKQPLAVATIVDSALALLNTLLMDEQIAVHISYADELPLIEVDPLHIEQVLINLMRNSVDALRQQDGQRRIEISAAACSDGIELAVRDNGPGLAPEMAQRLFHAFETSKTKGMGIGLAISRSIVEAHGGQIWADPPQPGGAVFRVTLPAL